MTVQQQEPAQSFVDRQSTIMGWAMLIASLVGNIMAAMIEWEKYRHAANPEAKAFCSFNEVVSCVDIMGSTQAYAFGISNTYIGILCFSVLSLVGVWIIIKKHLPEILKAIIVSGSIMAVAFVHWMAYSAIYVLSALCIYCIVVWGATLFILFSSINYTLLPYVESGETIGKVARFSSKFWWIVALIWYTLFFVVLFSHFGVSAVFS